MAALAVLLCICSLAVAVHGQLTSNTFVYGQPGTGRGEVCVLFAVYVYVYVYEIICAHIVLIMFCVR